MSGDHNMPVSITTAHSAAWLPEELTRSGSYSGETRAYLQVEEHAARDVLASASLREEGVEGVVASTNRLVAGHLSIRLDA